MEFDAQEGQLGGVPWDYAVWKIGPAITQKVDRGIDGRMQALVLGLCELELPPASSLRDLGFGVIVEFDTGGRQHTAVVGATSLRSNLIDGAATVDEHRAV